MNVNQTDLLFQMMAMASQAAQATLPPTGSTGETGKSDFQSLLEDKRAESSQTPERPAKEEDVPAKPGVPEMLRRLKAQGIKLCVATASDRELAEAALRRLGLLDLFDFILTCDEAGAGKRSPAVYEAALQKLGTSKTRTLVVEDALYALQTAHRAGFPTAAVADAHSAADQALLRQTADYYLFSFASCRIEK